MNLPDAAGTTAPEKFVSISSMYTELSCLHMSPFVFAMSNVVDAQYNFVTDGMLRLDRQICLFEASSNLGHSTLLTLQNAIKHTVQDPGILLRD